MSLSKEAIQKQREYQREWRARNKDRIREYNKRYWEKKAQEDKENKSDE